MNAKQRLKIANLRRRAELLAQDITAFAKVTDASEDTAKRILLEAATGARIAEQHLHFALREVLP